MPGKLLLQMQLGEASELQKPSRSNLLDWMLLKMTGLDLCKVIRKTIDTPILFLTARDTVHGNN
jgi:DNA-binding response OmpR family regulator